MCLLATQDRCPSHAQYSPCRPRTRARYGHEPVAGRRQGGETLIDLSALRYGLPELLGWYALRSPHNEVRHTPAPSREVRADVNSNYWISTLCNSFVCRRTGATSRCTLNRCWKQPSHLQTADREPTEPSNVQLFLVCIDYCPQFLAQRQLRIRQT